MKRLLALCLSFAVMASPVWAECPVMEKLASLDSRFTELYRKLDALTEGDLLAIGKPNWDTFNTLDQAIAAAKEAKEVQGDKWAEVSAMAPDVRAKFLATREAIRDRKLPDYKDRKYAPTEYELWRAYQKKIAELNQYLPSELRLPIVKLPKDPRLTEVPEAARKLIKENEAKVEALYATTGFADAAEFEKGVEGLGPEGQALLKAFRDETIRVAIRRPNRGRFWIEKTGFHNQFVTKSSNGANNNELRNKAEAGYTGMPKVDYETLDPELKPQYVYFKPPEGSGWEEYVSSQYGDDIYILKTENIRDRLTFTPGDSLNRYNSWTGAEVKSWDELMVPWKHRTLMIPFVWNTVQRSARFSTGYQAPELSGTTLQPFKFARRVGSEYTEGQIFGGLRLSDVREFHFTRVAPTGDFLKSLQEKGIKIFDATGSLDKPTPWTPPGAP